MTTPQAHNLKSDPWKCGFCDGIFGRSANNTWAKQNSYMYILKAHKYNIGYIEGVAERKKQTPYCNMD